MSIGEPIDKIITALKQERDELHLKLKLGNAEVKEQWDDLEKQLAKLTSKAELISDTAEKTGEQVLEAAKLAADEIKKGYDRIRNLL